MKEFCFEAHAHFDAENASDACRKLRDHFGQLAKHFDGTLSAEDGVNILNMASGQIIIRPANAMEMNS